MKNPWQYPYKMNLKLLKQRDEMEMRSAPASIDL
jgi:hypothetical protein